jgi:hypothetical protein
MSKKNKPIEDGFYDVHKNLIKHNDVIKIVKMRSYTPYHTEGKFYKVDCETFGIPCIIKNETGTACPISELDADFEIIQKTNKKA